jgi:hypothetical protein
MDLVFGFTQSLRAFWNLQGSAGLIGKGMLAAVFKGVERQLKKG